MRLGGRLAAAIEVLEDIERRHRPAADALKDWGLSHRFAGAGDRAAIGNIVYDALRRKRSAAWLLDADTPRALGFGALLLEWNETPESLNAALDGDKFAPAAAERGRGQGIDVARVRRCAATPSAPTAPTGARRCFRRPMAMIGLPKGRALSQRPPLDLRVNTLKADRDRVLTELPGTGGRSDAACAARHPHSADRRPRPPPERAGRTGLPEGLVRSAGRRLAGRRRACRRRTRHAGARLLRRRRRQDAGAVRSDGEPRPDLRLRFREDAAGTDLRPHPPLRQPQHPGCREAAGIVRRSQARWTSC